MDMDYREFTQALASSAPTPGGGGAAALVGAVGAALGHMVGALTVGKKKYAAVEAELTACMARIDALRLRLLELVQRDADCFAPLAAAYGMARDDPARAETLERATLRAAQPPLEMMQVCCEALTQIAVFAEKGSRLAVSDAGCAAACCRAALESAALNVFINTKSLGDRAAASSLNDRAEALLRQGVPLAERIYAAVRQNF